MAPAKAVLAKGSPARRRLCLAVLKRRFPTVRVSLSHFTWTRYDHIDITPLHATLPQIKTVAIMHCCYSSKEKKGSLQFFRRFRPVSGCFDEFELPQTVLGIYHRVL